MFGAENQRDQSRRSGVNAARTEPPWLQRRRGQRQATEKSFARNSSPLPRFRNSCPKYVQIVAGSPQLHSRATGSPSWAQKRGATPAGTRKRCRSAARSVHLSSIGRTADGQHGERWLDLIRGGDLNWLQLSVMAITSAPKRSMRATHSWAVLPPSRSATWPTPSDDRAAASAAMSTEVPVNKRRAEPSAVR